MPNGNNSAVEYLRQNKDKFSLDVLRQKLAEGGYPKQVIDSAIMEVFQLGGGAGVVASSAPAGATGFFDFKSVKVYRAFGEKLGDFLFGWLGSWLIYWTFVGGGPFYSVPRLLFGYSFFRGFYGLPFGFFGLIILIANIIGIVYFWKRRHYLARGLLFAILAPILLVAIGFGLLLLIFRAGLRIF